MENVFAPVDALCKQMREKQDEIDETSEKLKSLNEEMSKLEIQAMALLKAGGKKSYSSPYGTIGRVQHWNVKLPQGEENRQAFFQYLKEKGLYEDYRTVHATKLKSHFLEEKRFLEDNDPIEAINFKIPGLEDATVYEKVSFTNKRSNQ